MCLKNDFFTLLNSKRVKNYIGILSNCFPLFINDKIHSTSHAFIKVDVKTELVLGTYASVN